MTNANNLRRAVRLTLAAVAAAAVSGEAFAQQQAPAATVAQNEIETVVVTGSRIQTPNEISISPVTTITAVDIQQTGYTRTEDLINSLPSVVASQGANLSITADGTSTIDLRGLGAQRTLVLVDGRRLGPGSGDGRNYSDINQIPNALIQSVDVLTGGASAVYGADAVSGVVNFILNTNFEGVKIDGNYAFNDHNNHETWIENLLASENKQPVNSSVRQGYTKDLSFIAGSNFADNRGNATIYATYTNTGRAIQQAYDYSSCTLNGPSKKSLLGNGPNCGGSSTSAGGRFFGYNHSSSTVIDSTVDKSTGAFRPYSGTTDSYNYGALSYFLRPSERYTGGAFLHLDLNDHATVYAETMYSKNQSVAQYGPSGDFGNPAQINCAAAGQPGYNPLLTAGERAVICAPAVLASQQAGVPAGSSQLYILRRNVEGGGRQDHYSSNAFREVIGVKGDFAGGWKYDLSGQISLVDFQDQQANFLSNDRINNALNVVVGPNGQPTCASVVNGTDKNCVPWNIWVPGGVTPAATNYLSIPLQVSSNTSEKIVSGNISGDLGQYGVQLPTAKSGMKINVGAEYRQETSSYNPDLAFQEGLGAGGNGPVQPIFGEFHVSEIFSELHLPILDDKFMAQSLAFEGGYRYSSYTAYSGGTPGFNTNTFKLGLEWAPLQDLRARASYNRAIRAPNISELYQAPNIGSGGNADPCWGSTPQLTLAQCELTGVTAARYGKVAVNTAAQINTQVGGNPDLTPEIADTYSFGAVFTPHALPGFLFTVDYFDIKIKNAINEPNSTGVILGCANGTAALCSQIHRQASGSLWLSPSGYVQTLEANLGSAETRGADIQAKYRLNMDSMGKITFNLVGTWTGKFLQSTISTLPEYDCAGYYGATCGQPRPSWRHTLTTTWATPWAGLEATARWRYIGASKVDTLSSDPQLNGTTYGPGSETAAYNYLDVSAAMPVGGGVSLRLGINNLFDKDPPITYGGTYVSNSATWGNGNTYAQSYDVLGRYIYLHATVQF